MAPGLVTPEKVARGKRPTDVMWHTIVSPTGREKTGYPTQKPEGLLRRFVQASSRPGDLCLDPFAGSGTLGAVAAKLGRRYLLIDESPERGGAGDQALQRGNACPERLKRRVTKRESSHCRSATDQPGYPGVERRGDGLNAALVSKRKTEDRRDGPGRGAARSAASSRSPPASAGGRPTPRRVRAGRWRRRSRATRRVVSPRPPRRPRSRSRSRRPEGEAEGRSGRRQAQGQAQGASAPPAAARTTPPRTPTSTPDADKERRDERAPKPVATPRRVAVEPPRRRQAQDDDHPAEAQGAGRSRRRRPPPRGRPRSSRRRSPTPRSRRPRPALDARPSRPRQRQRRRRRSRQRRLARAAPAAST